MPVATVGTPQTINLGAADALIVSCSAVDAVASVAGSTGFIGAPYELGRVVGEQGRRFGPYGRAVTLIVSALSGTITAEVSQPSRAPDAAGALSAAQAAATQALVSGAGKYQMIAIGDSWAQRLTSSNATGVAAFLDDGPLTWAQALSGQKLDPLLPAPALGGSTSASWLGLIDAALANQPPCWVISFLGINDINSDVPVATITANLATIYGKVLAAGHNLIVCNVGPYGPTFVTTGATLAVKTAQRALLNRWIADFVAGRSNCWHVDTFALMVDPANVNGYSTAADADTNGTTGLHPSSSGSRKIGAAIAAIINANVTSDPHTHASSYTDGFEYDAASTNRLSNPLMLGTGGTNTPGAGTTITPTTIPASWNVATNAGGSSTTVCTTAARTVAADGDAIGQNAVLTISGANGTDQISLRQIGLTARFAEGDRVAAEMFVRLTGMTNVKGVRLLAQLVIGGTTYNRTAMSYQASGGNYLQSDVVMLLKTPELVLPAGAITAATFTLDIAFAGAGGATVNAGRASWRKLN